MTATTTTDQFPGHVAGDPYCLNREEFIRFAGLQDDYDAFLKVLQQKAASGRLPGNGHNYEPEIQAFWAAIASPEAMRTFNPNAESCSSRLSMDTQSAVTAEHIGCVMRWEYTSTSGTRFFAEEAREYQLESEYQCSDELPAPVFMVTIPATRDTPGRTHYEALRRGGSYRDF